MAQPWAYHGTTTGLPRDNTGKWPADTHKKDGGPKDHHLINIIVLKLNSL